MSTALSIEVATSGVDRFLGASSNGPGSLLGELRPGIGAAVGDELRRHIKQFATARQEQSMQVPAIPADPQSTGKRPGDCPAGALRYIVLPIGGPALILAEPPPTTPHPGEAGPERQPHPAARERATARRA